MTPEERSFQMRINAHRMHSLYDARETTAKGRKVFLDRFELEVVEAARARGGELTDPAEIARRARHAKSAYFQRLALKSAQARRGTGEAPSTVRRDRTVDDASGDSGQPATQAVNRSRQG